MKTTTVHAMEKGISLSRSPGGDRLFQRCKDHLLRDLVPTLLLLVIVASGALMGARSIHQAKLAHQITLIGNG